MDLQEGRVYTMRDASGGHIKVLMLDAPYDEDRDTDDRNGSKNVLGICVRVDDGTDWYLGETNYWCKDGSFEPDGDDRSDYDLVAEAREPRRFKTVIDGEEIEVEEVLRR